jgi:hypothetical protein
MWKNVLDAIRGGDWSYEPEEIDPACFEATSAIPGSQEKIAVMAARLRAGLPLWHKGDRVDHEEPDISNK